MDTAYVDSVFAAACRDVRSSVRVGRQWRLDSWEQLYAALSEHGIGFCGAAPGSAVYYAVSAEVTAEYLGEKPKQTRFRLLHRRLQYDLDIAGDTLVRMRAFQSGDAQLSCDKGQRALSETLTTCSFNEADVALMREAVMRSANVRDVMSQYCPGTP